MAKIQLELRYITLKEVEPDIKNLKESLNSESNSLSGNLTVIKQKRAEIENNIEVLKAYISTRLSSADYSYVAGILDSTLEDLSQIEQSLEAINDTYSDPDFIKAVNNLDSAIQQMDSMRDTLNNLDRDLEDSIIKTQESKARINSFIQRLNEGGMEVEDLTKKLGDKNALIDFKNSFIFSEDPVLLSFPLLISIIIAFTSIVLSNMFILKQTGQSSYTREILCPTRDFSFFISAYLTNLLFIFIQVFTLSLVGFYLFGTTFFESFGLMLLAIFLAVSIFIFIGMTLGYIVKTQSLSMLLSIFSVILFFVFSDLMASTALTSPIIKFFINLNPFVILNSLLFDMLLIKSDFYTLKEYFFRLTLQFITLFIIAYFARKINKKRVTEE